MDAPATVTASPTSANGWLRPLCELLAIPSVSGVPSMRPALDAAAAWLARHLTRIGLRGVRVLPGSSGGPPNVYGELCDAPAQPTLLLYGHYDVQPAGTARAWRTPPFRPVAVGERLYARGASDDKGQLFAQLMALEEELDRHGRLPVNVKVWLEGEEEIGSPGAARFLACEQERLRADAAIICDAQLAQPGRPALLLGLRGRLGVELEAWGPAGDLHAGRYGGAVANPLEALVRILASLHDGRGNIAVRGLLTGVRPGPGDDPSERDAANDLLEADGRGAPGRSAARRAAIRPALTITCVWSSAGTRTAIPGHARARLDMRLVPGQRPDAIARLLQRHVSVHVPGGLQVRLTFSGGARPVTLAPSGPVFEAAVRAVRAVWHVPPAFVHSGGTIPVVERLQRTGTPVLVLGLGPPDDHAHGPNEQMHLPTLVRGAETVRRLLWECAR
jgi:acetylornithine deacetylase/succinyl-diaminopimelate desuccinylase-like protein